jgi:hypothetical protein
MRATFALAALPCAVLAADVAHDVTSAANGLVYFENLRVQLTKDGGDGVDCARG